MGLDRDLKKEEIDKLANLSGTNTGDEVVFAGTTGVAGTNDGIVPDDGVVPSGRFLNDSGAWAVPATGSGINNVVEDTTPQLGGDLDVNGNNIISLATIDLIPNTDVTIQLGDTVGVNKLSITDNSPVEVFAVDSDGNVTLSGTVDGIDIATDVAANTLKVSNATHTGDVTGDTVLTIASKAVEIPMLDDGVDGELITWDAAGVATTVPTGTAGQLLTSNGAGTTPTFQNIAAIAWQPPTVPLGGVLVNGATFFINGGAGVYLSFNGGGDDRMFVNYALRGANGIAYDGSNLAITFHGRINVNGGVGDTVGLILSYAVIKDGDNSTTTVTNVAQQNVDVSTRLQDIKFDLTLATMTGVVGADTLMVTITRNSSGAGQDGFAGNYELLGITIDKV